MTYRNIAHIEDREEGYTSTLEFDDFIIEDSYIFIDCQEIREKIRASASKSKNIGEIELRNIKAKEFAKEIYKEIKRML